MHVAADELSINTKVRKKPVLLCRKISHKVRINKLCRVKTDVNGLSVSPIISIMRHFTRSIRTEVYETRSPTIADIRNAFVVVTEIETCKNRA